MKFGIQLPHLVLLNLQVFQPIHYTHPLWQIPELVGRDIQNYQIGKIHYPLR